MPRTRRSIPPSTTCVGRVDAFLTRAIFKHMLRRQAYSRDDFARMAAVLAVRPRRHRGGGDGVRRLAAQIVRDDLRRSGRAPDRSFAALGDPDGLAAPAPRAVPGVEHAGARRAAIGAAAFGGE